MQDYNRNDSRKYKLSLLIFFAATIMCIFPPVISIFVFKMTIPGLVILSGSEWITSVGMLGGFYFGANVLQKHLLKDSELSVGAKPNETDDDSQQSDAPKDPQSK